MKALSGKYLKEKKCFEIEISKDEKVEMVSSGLFDTERELMAWADKNDGKVLGYLDGSRHHEYVLVYGGELYDVEVAAK